MVCPKSEGLTEYDRPNSHGRFVPLFRDGRNSIEPILDPQSGQIPEVSEVPGEEENIVRDTD